MACAHCLPRAYCRHYVQSQLRAIPNPTLADACHVPFCGFIRRCPLLLQKKQQAAGRRPSIAAACSGCFPLTLAWLLLIGEPSPNVLSYWLGSPLVVAVVCVWCVVVCEGEGGSVGRRAKRGGRKASTNLPLGVPSPLVCGCCFGRQRNMSCLCSLRAVVGVAI